MSFFQSIFGGGHDKTSGPASSRGEAKALAMARAAIQEGGGVERLWVQGSRGNGDSMLPAIPANCYLVMERVTRRDELAVGDWVQCFGRAKRRYRDAGYYGTILLHRIIRLHPLRTRALNPTIDRRDFWATIERVDGRVCAVLYFRRGSTLPEAERNQMLAGYDGSRLTTKTGVQVA